MGRDARLEVLAATRPEIELYVRAMEEQERRLARHSERLRPAMTYTSALSR